MDKVTEKALSFSVDARTIIQLGRDSIKNPTTAVIELVKNGYDADAKKITVDIEKDRIKIVDDGTGMGFDTLRNSWLRIGYSEKKTRTHSPSGRRKTGEKGIGRISADRLGKKLTLTTKTSDTNAIKLDVNWDDFDTDGQDLSKINIPYEELQGFERFDCGTEIVIEDLRQNWLNEDIERLYLELSMLISPFAKRDDLQIVFNNYIAPEYNGIVATNYDEASELMIEASYKGTGDTIDYSILDRSSGTEVKTSKKIKLAQLTQDSLGETLKELSCGPVALQILFYSRSSAPMSGRNLSAADLRKFLDVHAGIKIYRDDISVKPFGYYKEPGGDWLGLAQRKERDPAGLSRPTYKVSSYQLVGAVSVSRDSNPWLRDGASREGLVENEAFNDLRSLTLSCVFLLEQHRHRQAMANKKSKTKQLTALEKVEDIKHDVDHLRAELIDMVSPVNILDDTTKGKIEHAVESIENVSQYMGEVIDENRVFRGLATIGISTAVFGHETQSTISRLKSQINSAYNALTIKNPHDIDRAVTRLAEAKDSSYHVAKWGQFALSRVKKDKRTRSRLDVDKIVIELLNEIGDVFKNSKIELIRDIEPVSSIVFVMDIESILLNLLTNAYAFAGNSQKKTVKVELRPRRNRDKDGYEIVVADSGPGVDEKLVDTIWEPLVSTKKDKFGYDAGTGLGLTIVSSTVNDMGGIYSVDKDADLLGAKFTIWIPIQRKAKK